MKPYDGGGWVGVSRVDDDAALRQQAYDESGTYLSCTCSSAVSRIDLLRARASASARRPAS